MATEGGCASTRGHSANLECSFEVREGQIWALNRKVKHGASHNPYHPFQPSHMYESYGRDTVSILILFISVESGAGGLGRGSDLGMCREVKRGLSGRKSGFAAATRTCVFSKPLPLLPFKKPQCGRDKRSEELHWHWGSFFGFVHVAG